MITKKQAFEIFKNDDEMQCSKDMNTGEDIPTGFNINNVIKAKTVFCPRCKSGNIWTTNFEEQYPEWTYICANCEIQFIAVWEKRI